MFISAAECTGLQGNWRGISRQYVTSRTPTQIASHAQKYSLRTSGVTKRRSRFSALEEQQAQVRDESKIVDVRLE